MAKSKTPPEPKTAEQVAKTPALFAARLGTKVVEIGKARFKVRALPSTLDLYVSGVSVNPDGSFNQGIYAYQLARFGVIEVTGLTDSEGQPVEVDFEQEYIDGENVDCLPRDFIKQLASPVIGRLRDEIALLTNLSFFEVDKLDFTSPSPETSSQGAGERLTVINADAPPLSS